MRVTRRHMMLGSFAMLALRPVQVLASDTDAKLAAIEKKYGGRLGVAILDTGNGKSAIHRADERFGLCSTFKFVAAAAVLARVDRGEERLDRRVTYTKTDLIEHAPVTEKHVGEGSMTLGDLCAAAVELSDNTAGNLLLRTLGGPEGLTKFMRGLGDTVSRLDRTEPTLNIVTQVDPRDTTTPAAMIRLMKAILVDDALSAPSRQQIETWMLNCKTGSKRIAAGLPDGWKIGDKTGTGPNGQANDIAIIWPPERAPILVASYYVGADNTPDECNAVHAEVGRLIS